MRRFLYSAFRLGCGWHGLRTHHWDAKNVRRLWENGRISATCYRCGATLALNSYSPYVSPHFESAKEAE